MSGMNDIKDKTPEETNTENSAKKIKTDTDAPCPCLFSSAANATSANVNANSVVNAQALTAEQKRNAPEFQEAIKANREFLKNYAVRLPALDAELWDIIRAKPFDKLINKQPPAVSTKLPSFIFPYVPLVNGRAAPTADDQVSSEIFADCNGSLYIEFPGERTPVCHNIHFGSFFNENLLKEFKQAGIDVIFVVTSGIQDTLWDWTRNRAGEKGLLHLVPDTLPTLDVNARIKLDPNMPLFVAIPDTTLAFTNMHGLVTDGRLTPHPHRGVSVYDAEQRFRLQIKPESSAEKHCEIVKGPNVLKEVQNLNLKNASRPKL